MSRLTELAARIRKAPEPLTPEQFAARHHYLVDGPAVTAGFPVPWQPTWPPGVAVLRAIGEHAKWRQIIEYCSPQTSKSDHGMVIPIEWCLFERRWSCAYVTSSVSDADDFWVTRLRAAIDASPGLREQLPDKSEGGDHQLRLFTNGGELYVRGAENQLKQFTARAIFIDDLQAITPHQTFGHPLDQAPDRFGSFPSDQRLLVAAGTAGHKGDRIETEFLAGTQHEMWLPCPDCGHFARLPRTLDEFLDRAVFDDSNPVAAAASCAIRCPRCSHHWRSEDKAWQLEHARVIGLGQTVASMADDGAVAGELVATNVFSITWNRLGWPWRRYEDAAALYVGSKDSPDKLKTLRQNELCEAVDPAPEGLGEGTQSAEEILSRHTDDAAFSMGEVPEWCDLLTIGIDAGHQYITWLLQGWLMDGGDCAIIDADTEGLHGAPRKDEILTEEQRFARIGNAVEAALARIEARIARGWICGSKIVRPSVIFGDANFLPTYVKSFCNDRSRRGKWDGRRAARGWYAVQGSRQPRAPILPDKMSSNDSGQWLMLGTVEAKNVMAMQLQIPLGEQGSWHLFRGDRAETVARHFSVEHYDERKGLWVRPHGQAQHYWDCGCYGFCAAYAAGVKFGGVGRRTKRAPKPQAAEPVAQPDRSVARPAKQVQGPGLLPRGFNPLAGSNFRLPRW